MESEPVFSPDTTLIVAAEGWSDAGEAASSAARALIDHYNLQPLHTVDAETYFDFQLTRPYVENTPEGQRVLIWPDITLYGPVAGVSPEDAPFVLLGAEPSRLWRSLAQEIMDWVLAHGIDAVISLGAMLADVPHSRPVRLLLASDDPIIRSELDIERSSYEGPVGILTVLAMQATSLDLSALQVWAQVPHYVHTSPSPKATLALLDKIAELVGVSVPREEWVEQAQQWEHNIDQLAADDDEMTSYIRQLEKARDTVESPEASGDAIAREFERYLRRGPDRPGTVAGSDSEGL